MAIGQSNMPGLKYFDAALLEKLDILLTVGAWVIIKVSGHQYWWLAVGYDLEIGHF